MMHYKVSLTRLLGEEYMESVISAAQFCQGLSPDEARALAHEEFLVGDDYIARLDGMTEKVGKEVIPPSGFSEFEGAPTDSFRKAARSEAAPVGGVGPYRTGEDGRLYFAAKSEHYHTPLGHNFPAYNLLRNASMLGITNATHNNTRGYITRLAEYELIKAANRADDSQMGEILASREERVLNRVINLETGSLACEAGIKMMLMRFYRLDNTYDTPKYSGRIPVFFVMGDNEGGSRANYHGTTVLAQTFRGMWPELYDNIEKNGLYKVVSVKINDIEDFRRKLSEYDSGRYKAAGFIHEIILMNYGGIRLEKEFLRQVYDQCHKADIPVMCDEIQSCMWYRDMFLFLEYKLDPDFVIIGKGFPGGCYAASRILTTYPLDKLSQFGALVTNGQEELASLSYLITMDYAKHSGDYTEYIGKYYHNALVKLAEAYSGIIDKIEGHGLLSTIFFKSPDIAAAFAKEVNESCIDVGVQTYKASCPPAVLSKPPIIITEKMADFIVSNFERVLHNIEEGKR